VTAQAAAEVDAVHHRHVAIGDEQVGRFGAEHRVEGGTAVGDDVHEVPVAVEFASECG
jgi:hypothetical protein